MSQIHILDGQSNQGEILDYITSKNIIEDNHKKNKEDTLETYNFITFADKRFSEYLEKRNRLTIPDEDDTLREFVIFEAVKYKDTEGHKAQVFAHASYLELKKASILHPSTYEGTASQHGGRTLNDTGWQIGIVEGKGTRKLTIENHTNPYEMLKRIAREFELELRFRVEHNGNKITGRYVDLLERIGEWRGQEVEFGKDLVEIRRIEKQDIVTALLGLGPEDEDGNRLEVLVEDEEALQRWGRVDEHGRLHHLIEPYEIQSSRTEMTEKEARQYTRTALNKRINTQVTYEGSFVDLENVPGMQNKKIRFGDTIRIKDTTFNPPLYLEARIFEQTRSIKSKAKKDFKLGDYIEYSEEEVNAIWQQLQNEIRNRVSRYEMMEYTYDKLTIDDKDETVFKDGKTFAEATGIKAEENAKDFAVEQDAKIKVDVEGYADTVAEQQAESALSQAKQYAVAKEVYDNQMVQIASDLEDRAPLEYVDGEFRVIKGDLDKFDAEIEKKVDGSTVYTISEVDNMINNTVSITEYETDKDGIVKDLTSQGTRIGQNEKAIGLKADSSALDAVNNSLTTKIGNVEVTAEGAKMTANQVKADLDDVDGRVEKLDASVTTLAGEVSLKASQSIVDSLEGRVENAEGELSVLPGQISLKADVSDVYSKTQVDATFDAVNAQIEMKVDDGEARSIFLQEADAFTFDASQVNFTGHVFGKNAAFEGELKAVTGTFGDVTVIDGDFNLQDASTKTKYSATPKRNIIKDHSFELVLKDHDSMTQTSIDNNWIDVLKIDAHLTDSPWEAVGSPKLSQQFDVASSDSLAIYGDSAAIVRGAHYFRQYIFEGVGGGGQYTISAFFKRAWRQTSGGIPLIQVWHVSGESGRQTRVVNARGSAVKNNYSVERHSATFTVPTTFKIGDSLEVIVGAATENSYWIQCDGVQMVEGDRPSVYEPEDSVWQITQGNYGAKREMGSPLWFGTQYPTATQTAVPKKLLGDCRNGWILQWQAYIRGSGVANSNYQYTFIPKEQIRNGKGNRLQLGATGGVTVSKYVYISDEGIGGHASNNQGDNDLLALTEVYEW